MSILQEGLGRYLSPGDLAKLSEVVVGIGGAGGLGSNCAMALARSGVRHFVIVDDDVVEPSNLNRQYFFADQVGQPKVEALRDNLLRLDGDLDVVVHQTKMGADNIGLLFGHVNCFVEAVDGAETKVMLLEQYRSGAMGHCHFFVTASGLAGYGASDELTVKALAPDLFIVGNGYRSIATAPPLAPMVNIAASKEADLVLSHILAHVVGPRTKDWYGNLGRGQGRRAAGMANFEATPVYALTDERQSLGRPVAQMVQAMVDGGVKFLQYRDKYGTGAQHYVEAKAAADICRAAGCTFIVDDYIDVALAVDADGVHIGQDDIDPIVARRLLGPDRIIGLSTHSPEQYEAAIALNNAALARGESPVIDYIGVGPVYPTKTKDHVVGPVGLAYVRYAAEQGSIPFVAIGGIKTHNVDEVYGAGATTVCVVSEITMAEDVSAKVRELAEHKANH